MVVEVVKRGEGGGEVQLDPRVGVPAAAVGGCLGVVLLEGVPLEGLGAVGIQMGWGGGAVLFEGRGVEMAGVAGSGEGEGEEGEVKGEEGGADEGR